VGLVGEPGAEAGRLPARTLATAASKTGVPRSAARKAFSARDAGGRDVSGHDRQVVLDRLKLPMGRPNCLRSVA
jgi:hypothetical protein